MEKFLDGKVALITGGAQGVGFGIAEALTERGAKLMLMGRTADKLEKACEAIAAKGGEAIFHAGDVTDEADLQTCLEKTLAHFSKLSILVNNAQVVAMGPLLDMDEDTFNQGWNSGALASFRLMRAAYPHLKGDGVIINVLSSVMKRWDMSGFGGYGAAKAAMQQLTRAAACEWGEVGIRVNAIMPHAKSPALKWWMNENPEEAEAFQRNIPLKRVGECTDDIGRFVAQLCAQDAAYVTGQTIGLDGGQAFIG